jgi:Asp/Glu/hydantoin racemase
MRILFMMPAAKGVYTPEAAERRINLVKSYATSSMQIDVDYLPESSGFLPWGGQNVANHRSPENMRRTHELGARRAAQAEKEGYDAFCPYGGVDVGVKLARQQGVKIPMSGPGEASALLCALIGRPFASCSYLATHNSSEGDKDRYRDLYRDLGIGHLHVASTAIGIANNEFPQRRNEVLERFQRCAREAREMGAELMGFLMQSICPTEFSAKELFEATELPCMDGIAAQISIVEMWHRTGLPQSLVKIPR